MNLDFVARCCAAALMSGAMSVLAQDGNDEGVFEPGVRHVCVPAADGEGWDCGTDDKPPANYRETAPSETVGDAMPAAVEPEAAAATAEESSTPAPPPFLADPSRDTPYAAVATSDEPAVAEVAETPAATPAEPLVEATAAVAPTAESPAETAPASSASETAPPEPVAEPVTPVAPVIPVATASVGAFGSESDFMQLPATAFTLQLAYARDTSTFAQLISELGLDPATCYALQVRGPDGRTWLLAHGAFADAPTARAAQSTLPRVAGLSAQWPRRIGALQTELTEQGR